MVTIRSKAEPMIYRSPYPGVSVPDVALVDFIFKNMSGRLEKPALIDGVTGEVLTYGNLIGRVHRKAHDLAASGICKDDVVAIYGPNSPDYVSTFYALTTLGAIVTTPNPLHNFAELTYQLRNSGARALIASSRGSETVLQAAERTGIKQVFTLEDVPKVSSSSSDRDWQPQGKFDPLQQIATVTYSNGTTDVPMGVMLTHRNHVANVIQTSVVDPIESAEVLIGMMPFCQMYGMVAVNLGLHAGATIVTLPHFNLRSLLEVMDRYRVTTAYLVPAIIRSLAKHRLLEQFDLAALKHIVSLTAPLPEAVAKACEQRIGCSVRQAYGLTEAVAFTHFTPRGQRKLAEVGVAVPNTEFRVVDVATQEDVASGKLGELLIRGPQVMQGYLDFPEVTEQIIDEDGWLHTCDVGFADEDGYLTIVDRSKRLVRLRGLHRQDADLLRAAVEDIAGRREAAQRVGFQSVLLDSVKESVVATDLNDRVTFWNKGAERLFGYSASEALGKPVGSLIVPIGEHLTNPEKTMALRTFGTWNTHARRRHKDGSLLWTDLTVSLVRDMDGERSGFVGIHRDITEQKEVAERLRFQAQLLDCVHESVLATDLDGRIVFWGKGAAALFGYSAEHMLGRHLVPLTLQLGKNPLSTFERLRDEVLQEGVWSGRAQRCLRGDSEFWADIELAPVKDENSEPVGLIAVHHDVTELRRNQALLKDSLERVRNLAGKLLVIREQERSAIARELHDELGQALTRLSIDLCWLTGQLPKRLKIRRVQSMSLFVEKMLKTVQDLSSELRPAILDDLGLEAAVEWQTHEFSDWSGCKCSLELQIGALPGNRDRDIAIFRILQEALTNVARHAKAHSVAVRAWTDDKEFVLEIEDDGVGILDGKLTSSQSLGIIGMRERTEGLGGEISIGTRNGHGCVVLLRVPIIGHLLSEIGAS